MRPWFYPVFSTRWHDQFGYAQVKTEFQTGLPVVPYLSIRFVGDTRQTTRADVSFVTPGGPQYLSESSFIVGGGLRSVPWHGLMLVGSRQGRRRDISPGMCSQIIAAASASLRASATGWPAEAHGLFADTTLDGIFVSRFGNDFLVYSQTRAGFTVRAGEASAQIYWNGNITIDDQRQYWANYGETGPGIRFRLEVHAAIDVLHRERYGGRYFVNARQPLRIQNFNGFERGDVVCVYSVVSSRLRPPPPPPSPPPIACCRKTREARGRRCSSLSASQPGAMESAAILVARAGAAGVGRSPHWTR